MKYLLAGDSTVAPCPVQEHPMSGWGPHLASQLGQGEVINFARGGATTRSFVDDGAWAALLEAAEPGDRVLIQFGHNDQKNRPGPDLSSRGGYWNRLRAMIDDVREAGAFPVLCTSVERRTFTEDGRLAPSHGDYPNAVRDLAQITGVDLIDLTAFSTWLFEDAGPQGSAGLFCHFDRGEHPNWPEGLTDDTHFHERGARRIAAYVAQRLSAFARANGDRPPLGSDARH
jgi:lysophospholipase L1-like esterase